MGSEMCIRDRLAQHGARFFGARALALCQHAWRAAATRWRRRSARVARLAARRQRAWDAWASEVARTRACVAHGLRWARLAALTVAMHTLGTRCARAPPRRRATSARRRRHGRNSRPPLPISPHRRAPPRPTAPLACVARSARIGAVFSTLATRGSAAHRVLSLGGSWRRWASAVHVAREALARRVEALTRARHPPARPDWHAAEPPAGAAGYAGYAAGVGVRARLPAHGAHAHAHGAYSNAASNDGDARLRAAQVARSLRATALSAGRDGGVRTASSAGSMCAAPGAGGSGAPRTLGSAAECGACRAGLDALLSATMAAGGGYAYKLSDFRRLEPRDAPTRREQMRAALTPHPAPHAVVRPRSAAASWQLSASAHATRPVTSAAHGQLAAAHLRLGAAHAGESRVAAARHAGHAAGGTAGLAQPPAGWTAPRMRAS